MKIAQIERDGESFAVAATRTILSLPADEVMTLGELAGEIGKPIPTAASVKNKLKPHSYLAIVDGVRQHVYGSPKGIVALKKSLAKKRRLASL